MRMLHLLVALRPKFSFLFLHSGKVTGCDFDHGGYNKG
jgi:hypothetical protein